MNRSPFHRRTLLQGSATVACLALAGLPKAPAAVATEPVPAPLNGALVGWLVFAPDGGGRIRLVELDPDANPVQQVAEEALTPAASLAGAAPQASAAAVRAAATCWGVPAAECGCARGRISHPPTGRTVPFTIWTDFA